MSKVADFVRRYVREYDYFAKVSELCGMRLERLLHAENVRAITTWRAKRPDRLNQKLEEREKSRIDKGKTAYESDEDIYNDIPDLAGARVALYFPADREKLRVLIEKHFRLLQPVKIFPLATTALPPEAQKRKLKKRFSGYSAEHFRVTLLSDDLSFEDKKYADGRCEIQVASVLMHAWAEVEHDLEYKALSGGISDTESSLLDQINGLVTAGEIALEELQKATILRVTGTDDNLLSVGRMRDQYDLASWLHAVALQLESEKTISYSLPTGRTDIAYGLLQRLHMTSNEEMSRIKGLLHKQDYSNISPETPMSEILVELLLREAPERGSVLQQVKAEIVAAEQFIAPPTSGEVTLESAALGHFLTKWKSLESALSEIGEMGFQRNTKSSKLNDVEKDTLRTLYEIRTNAVHATIQPPSVDELFAAAKKIDRLIENLRAPSGALNAHPMTPSSEAKHSSSRTLNGDSDSSTLQVSRLEISCIAAALFPEAKEIGCLLDIQNRSSKDIRISTIALTLYGHRLRHVASRLPLEGRKVLSPTDMTTIPANDSVAVFAFFGLRDKVAGIFTKDSKHEATLLIGIEGSADQEVKIVISSKL